MMVQILLAEDDEGMRTFLARGLTRAGYIVDAFADGETALEQARRCNYDLLLADVVMPGMDGIELARHVTTQQPGIHVMFITCFAAVALQDDHFLATGPKVLAKPFHLRHLIEEIEHLLLQ